MMRISKRCSVVFVVELLVLISCSTTILAKDMVNLSNEIKDNQINDIEISVSYFTQNIGQVDSEEIQFYSPDGNVYFASTCFYFKYKNIVKTIEEENAIILNNNSNGEQFERYTESGIIFKYKFIGSNDIIPEGRKRCSWNSNYFIGNDPQKWRTNVPNFVEVVYSDLWDGIDLVFRLHDGAIKYDLILHQGADPDLIQFEIEGPESMSISPNGDLIISTFIGELTDHAPVVFYADDPNIKIKCCYNIEGEKLGFTIEKFDKNRELVIDPLIDSTLIGGGHNDRFKDMALDNNGNVYVTGKYYKLTTTAPFPTTPGAYSNTYQALYDIVVFKMNANLSTLLYSTYVGGGGTIYNGDTPMGIAVDSGGCAYVCGYTYESNFPTTSGAYDRTHNGGLTYDHVDIVVFKLNAQGSNLQYSTFIGGGGVDEANDICLDPSNNAYITGKTYSSDFPTTSNAINSSYSGDCVFLCKINSLGTSLLYSSFIGYGEGLGIEYDNDGSIFLSGVTESSVFPTTNGSFDTTFNGWKDVFITKVNRSLISFDFSSYVGGSKDELAYDILTDEGYIYIAGITSSSGLATADSFDATYNGAEDIFILKMNGNGSSLVYFTYIGKDESDICYHMDIDPGNNIYLTGYTESSGYPLSKDAEDTNLNIHECMITILEGSGKNILYSSFFDPSVSKSAILNKNFELYIAGDVYSNFPTTPNAYDSSYNGGSDIFISHFIQPVPPSMPRNLTGMQYHNNITLRWQDPSYLGHEIFQYFSIYRSDNGSDYAKLADTIQKIYYDINVVDSGRYSYYVTCTNPKGESLGSNIIEIYDSSPPKIKYLSGNTGHTGNDFKVTVEVKDNIFVENVNVEYWFTEDQHLNVSMLKDHELYNRKIPIPEDSLIRLKYMIWARDPIGNYGNNGIKQVEIRDDDAPWIEEYLMTPIPTTGDIFNFSIKANDNIGIGSVNLLYWYGDDKGKNVTMIRNTEDNVWSHEIIIKHTFQSLKYYFIVKDTSNNVYITEEYVKTVIDNDLPEINLAKNPSNLTAGKASIFSLIVADNIEVSGAHFEYYFNESYNNISMIRSDNNEYILRFSAPNILADIHFWYTVYDTSGNWNKSSEFVITILDHTKPDFTNDPFYSEVIGCGENTSFQIEVYDNIQIDSVEMIYRINNGDTHTVVMNYTGLYFEYILYVAPNIVGDIMFVFCAVDTSKNLNYSNNYYAEIIDGIPPTIEDIEDITIYAGQSFSIKIKCLDNINIQEVIWFGLPFEGDREGLEGRLENPGTYEVTVLVNDDFGNNVSKEFIILVYSVTHDSDGDGIPDLWEKRNGLDMNMSDDGDLDIDNDNLTNLQEYCNGTNPREPDSDGDGLPDGWEIGYGLDPISDNTNKDTDEDGIFDIDEFLNNTDPTQKNNDEDDSTNLGLYILIIIIIAVFIMLLAGIGGFLFINRMRKNRNEKETSVEPGIKGSLQENGLKEVSDSPAEMQKDPFKETERLRRIALSKGISIAHLEVQYGMIKSFNNNPNLKDMVLKQVAIYNRNVEEILTSNNIDITAPTNTIENPTLQTSTNK